MRYTFIVLALLGFVINASALRTFMRGRHKNGNLGEPNLSKEYKLPKEQWLEQNLDHFNPTERRTWQQRYFVNSDYYKPGGPIFLLIGGEGEASAKWMVEGQWIEYAKRFNAMCFQVEHRFYGKSHPTSDLSVKNLVYLSSEQALADLAHFIQQIPTLHQIPRNSRWIAFGGSYAGALAAWLRAKYPYLVHGAVSSSAPLQALIDFQQYFVIVDDSLKQHSQACVDAIVAANAQVHIMLRHPLGQRSLAKLFNLCDPIDPGHTKRTDISNFYETLAGNFAEVVQYNGDNRNSSKAINYTIKEICDVLVNDKDTIPVNRLAKVSNMMLTSSNESCLDYKYSKMVDQLRNISWADEAAEGGRQWTYQTCTEFGFFQTSTARPKLFSETFPAEFFIQQCTDIFGPRYNIDLLEGAIERTNTFYGALDIYVTNVVFVHGTIDPWHALGITKSMNPKAPSIYINGTAHCADMYPVSPKDPVVLQLARQQIGDMIALWLST